MKVCTYNVHRLLKGTDVCLFLNDNHIDICGMQEVAGKHSLERFVSDSYVVLFDDIYKTYGNGLVYLKSKFELLKKSSHVIASDNGKNKKTVLYVQLKYIDTGKVINVFVTHFNHISEDKRVLEWNALLKYILSQNTESYIILGDFNTLTRNDYTDAEWESITKIRKQNNWEAPKTVLSELIAKNKCIDCLQKYGKPVPTCRFDTRVDYIFINETFQKLISNIQVQVYSSQGSDHNPVVMSFTI